MTDQKVHNYMKTVALESVTDINAAPLLIYLKLWSPTQFVPNLNLLLDVGYYMNIWGVVILELNCHPDHNKGPDYAP